MMSQHILVIDEGTTSTRAMLFAVDGTCLGSVQKPLTQSYPAPGMVEHDANEIWQHSLSCAQEMVLLAGGAQHIAAIGITNQRETIVFWDKRTGEPLAPAIVWQDRRTAEHCALLKAQGHENMVQDKTGLLLDPYFSASKIGWALRHWPQLKDVGNHLAVGTIDSYLIYRLTNGLHVSDATNASRTALMAIEQGAWDDELLGLFQVPRTILPEIIDSAGALGFTKADLFGAPIAITGIAGDQQAATIGQACFDIGQTKITYGTGAFALTQTGEERRHSKHRLLSTVLWQIGGERHYALEGSVFVAGSLIQWLRDDLALITASAETEALARSVPDNGGVYLVPALSGLGAPHWQPDARGAITGLSFASQKAHIARAALEAMAYQTFDLQSAFAADGAAWAELRVDGGMAENSWMVQDVADILALPVERPNLVETTALGAAMLAALGAGLYPDLKSTAQMRGKTSDFLPVMQEETRSKRLLGWKKALSSVLQ